jgi:HJR/Mrr/RecB family endonuclease
MRTMVVIITLSLLSAIGMRLHAAESPPSAEGESTSSAELESTSSAEGESTSSAEAESSSAAAPAVKLSPSGICHEMSSQYYPKLKEYQSFDSMTSCIAAGGQQRSAAKARNSPTQDAFPTTRESSWINLMVSGLKEHDIIWLLLVSVVGLWLLVTSRRSRRRHWLNRRTEPKYGEREYRRWPGHRIPGIEPLLAGSTSPPTEWNLELLHALEWHRLEILAAAYFERFGFQAKLTPFGPDGGVDIELIAQRENVPAILVQCKARRKSPVGVKEARELLGIMAHRKVVEGILITSGRFSVEAREFVKGHTLRLIDGSEFLCKIGDLGSARAAELLKIATEGDYTTPTCPSCGIKMLRRQPKTGATPFWGCRNYPRCRAVLEIGRGGS